MVRRFGPDKLSWGCSKEDDVFEDWQGNTNAVSLI